MELDNHNKTIVIHFNWKFKSGVYRTAYRDAGAVWGTKSFKDAWRQIYASKTMSCQFIKTLPREWMYCRDISSKRSFLAFYFCDLYLNSEVCMQHVWYPWNSGGLEYYTTTRENIFKMNHGKCVVDPKCNLSFLNRQVLHVWWKAPWMCVLFVFSDAPTAALNIPQTYFNQYSIKTMEKLPMTFEHRTVQLYLKLAEKSKANSHQTWFTLEVVAGTQLAFFLWFLASLLVLRNGCQPLSGLITSHSKQC